MSKEVSSEKVLRDIRRQAHIGTQQYEDAAMLTGEWQNSPGVPDRNPRSAPA